MLNPVSGPFAHLSDPELIAKVRTLSLRERKATAELIVSLAEFDARSLYLGQGCSSLFTYCTQVLHLSEHASYGRIEAARAARRFPVILELLIGGEITLTTISLLAPHLTAENHSCVLEAARHKSKREVEQLVAALRPLPAVPQTIRKLPSARIVEALIQALIQESSETGSDAVYSVSSGAPEATLDSEGYPEPPADTAHVPGSESNRRTNGIDCESSVTFGGTRQDVSTEDSATTRSVGIGTRGDASALNLLERSKTATAAVGTTDPEGAASRARRLDTLAVAASVARSRPMSQPAIVAPLSLDSYRVQFTVPRQTYEKLRRVQDLLRHQIPNGDLAAIFDRALTLLLRETEKKKIGLASGRDRSSPPTARKSSREHSRSRPPGRSRRIPAGVRREVWRRDGGQCAFVSESGRCSETGFLEFHHVLPFASGGAATVENIQLRCRSHNSHEAQEYFGRVQNAAEVSDEVSAALRDGPTVVDGRAEYLELGPDRVQPEPQKAPEKAQTDAGGFETAASERGSPPVRAE